MKIKKKAKSRNQLFPIFLTHQWNKTYWDVLCKSGKKFKKLKIRKTELSLIHVTQCTEPKCWIYLEIGEHTAIKDLSND